MKFISIGGWCGTTGSLRGNNLYDEALPFDHIRSTFKGVIECFEDDFLNFLPKKLKYDTLSDFPHKIFRGKDLSFFYHDLSDPEVIQTFEKRIDRLKTILQDALESEEKVIFVRTIVAKNHQDELDLYEKFLNVIDSAYSNLKYILILIIPAQEKTTYFKSLNNRAFVFTVNDNSACNQNIPHEYSSIYKFILNQDLFTTIPDSRDLVILKKKNRFSSFSGLKVFRD